MPTTARFTRTPHETAAPIVISRQPIFDLCERIVAFELLTPVSGDPRETTAGVLARALMDIGLPRLAGSLPVHVDVTREFLLAVRPLPFAPAQVVLEVAADQPADAELLAALREAYEAGFRIALDGFRPHAGAEALLDIADSVKLDVARLDPDELELAVNEARGRGLRVIAGGVHTRRSVAVCRGLGFDAFQGRYFAEPELVTGMSAPTHSLHALSVLAADEATSFEELEQVISEDPGLSFKLLKLANSAFFGGRQRVGTVRQAILTIGSVNVRRWATMLALAGAGDRPSHLLELGLLRARLSEQLARRTPGSEPERAFTVGLFSIADSLLGMRMSDVLAELPFDERTEFALAEHDGPEGRLLAGVLAYERGDFEACSRAGVSLADLALVCAEAFDWTGNVALQLAA